MTVPSLAEGWSLSRRRHAMVCRSSRAESVAASVLRLNDRLQRSKYSCVFSLRVRGDVLAVVQVVDKGFVAWKPVEMRRIEATEKEGSATAAIPRLQAWRENQALGGLWRTCPSCVR